MNTRGFLPIARLKEVIARVTLAMSRVTLSM